MSSLLRIKSSPHIVTLFSDQAESTEFISFIGHHKFHFKMRLTIPPVNSPQYRIGDHSVSVDIKNGDILKSNSQHVPKDKKSCCYDVFGTIKMEFFPSKSGVILIQSAGLGESHLAYSELGRQIAKNGPVTFVSYSESGMRNLLSRPFLGIEAITSDLDDVIRFCLKNSKALCGKPEPDIYLAGVSAGGGASAAVSGRYPQIKKLLLISYSPEYRVDFIEKALSLYDGELYAFHCKDDPVIPYSFSQELEYIASRAKSISINISDTGGHGENITEDLYLSSLFS